MLRDQLVSDLNGNLTVKREIVADQALGDKLGDNKPSANKTRIPRTDLECGSKVTVYVIRISDQPR